MSNRRDRYTNRKRSKKYKPQKKTEYERQRTREEVRKIKKDLINYARTSWGKEWIKSNLEIGRPFRMQRGIEYANDERRIDNISINPGEIFATVQGTAPTPYRVKINFEIINEEVWDKIIERITKVPFNLIEMLEGKLPEEIIQIFQSLDLPLFPNASKAIDASCSCPDKEIPCKHIASIILYLSRVLDFDPFMLLKLRGKSKEEILINLSLKNNTQINNNTSPKLDNFNVPIVLRKEITGKKSVEDLYISFNIKKRGKILETLENLRLPQNPENNSFETVLRVIYHSISLECYKISYLTK